MTNPNASIRKLLWLADHAGTPIEGLLARQRAGELARKYKIDLAATVEPPAEVHIDSSKYDWFHGAWLDRDKW